MDFSKLQSQLKNAKAALKPKERTIKPQPGANRYILMPGWRSGEEHVWYREFGQHYIKNEADELLAVYPCSEVIDGKPCEICEGLARAQYSASTDELVEVLKKAKASRNYLVNVLALDSDDPSTPQILEVRPSVLSQLVEALGDWAPQIFDESEPQVIVINRDGKGLNTKYSVQVTPKKHSVNKATFARLHNLDEYVQQESDEQQRRALTAINRVAGVLPAPSNDRPSTVARPALSSELPAGDPPIEVAARPARVAASVEEDLDSLLGELN